MGNGYSQVANSPTRGNALFDIYLVRPVSAFTFCSNVQRISDHCGVLLEVEWGENSPELQVERLVPMLHKTKSQVYKVSSGVNSHYGQVMVVAWRKFGNVLRKQSSRAAIVLSHTKFCEKILILNTTIRK